VSDQEAATVRLFDKVGSKWVQRGEALKGPKSENVSMNKYSAPIVTLSVGAYEFGFVSVYKCKKNGCEQIGHDINGHANSVSLSKGEIPLHVIPYDRQYNFG
jgi:hypothetical protein